MPAGSPRRMRSKSPARNSLAVRPPRKTRWSADQSKIVLPGVPTQLPGQLTDEQLKQFLRVLRIEDIGRRLRMNEVLPAYVDPRRPPSPEPEYGPDGMLMNTRESRYRQRLEEERTRLVEEALREDSTYRAPPDMVRLQQQQQQQQRPAARERPFDKIYLPALEFPEVNFLGLLIGPRGNTLKQMEAETGAKISIRGRGVSKEGKASAPGMDEELHCYISGDTEEAVARAVETINNIVEQATSAPGTENQLKKQQLRELAVINGTLSGEGAAPDVYARRPGEEHRGGSGQEQQPPMDPDALRQAQMRSQEVSYDYQKFLAEIDGGTGAATAPSYAGQAAAYGGAAASMESYPPPWQQPPPHAANGGGAELPPWHAAESTGAPPMDPNAPLPWHQPPVDPNAPPPWARVQAAQGAYGQYPPPPPPQ